MIIRIKGGNSLGNQMFEYALYKFFEKRFNDGQVFLDFSAIEKDYQDDSVKQSITDYNICFSSCNKKILKKTCLFRHNQKFGTFKYRFFLFLESFFNKKYYLERERFYIEPDLLGKYEYLDGYWQSWRYPEEVRDILLRDFSLKNGPSSSFCSLLERIKNSDSVMVGIRRGDYLDSAKTIRHYGLFSSEYYLSALSFIKQTIRKPTLFIFSNDIEWVKKNVRLDAECVYIEPSFGLTTLEEQQLMRQCKHAIIPNSTFHWWGAWLIENKDKIVVAPSEWFADGTRIDIVPPDWIKMKRNGELEK